MLNVSKEKAFPCTLIKKTSTQIPDYWGIECPVLSQRQIAKLRTRMNLTQAEMARLLGVANTLTISHWETGVSMPKGAVMRFLCLLDALSESELSKITAHLDNISKQEEKVSS